MQRDELRAEGKQMLVNLDESSLSSVNDYLFRVFVVKALIFIIDNMLVRPSRDG